MKYRRYMAMWLVIAMVFQMLSSFSVQATKQEIVSEYQNLPAIEIENQKNGTDETSFGNVEDRKNPTSENVRVIVELEGEPVIEEAIRRGISYHELDKQIIEQSEERIAEEQTETLADIANVLQEVPNQMTENKEVLTYNTGFNGFAMTVKSDDIRKIENQTNVKRVFISEEFQRPQMHHSQELIGAMTAWNTYGLKGEGMVVAVIDTGIDYTHDAMVLDDGSQAKLTETEVSRIISENGLKGKYFTEKVPYGYNYYDHNHNTMDAYGVMHGMHVAGTVGANKKKGATVEGIAPNVQLLALKVFSDDIQHPTTFTDVWLKAMDDAIALKADVINMSLGTPAGFASKDKERPEERAIEKAKKAGIAVVIAVGNDGNIMTGNYHGAKALVENPDTSLLSSPAIIEDSIAVASVDNKVRYRKEMSWQGSNTAKQNAKINVRFAEGKKEVSGLAIDLEDGYEEDYQDKNVEGKIVLLRMEAQPREKSEESASQQQSSLEKEVSEKQEEVSENFEEASVRQEGASKIADIKTEDKESSEKEIESDETTSKEVKESEVQSDDHDHEHKHTITLEERIRLAEEKNPLAIILYNSQAGGENLGKNLNYLFPLFDVTLAVVGYQAGQKILQDMKADSNVMITLSGEIVEEDNTQGAKKISAFSTWGPTPDLRIKPEITAPGGNILSTAEDNKVQSMSGTSMATPHVAAATAIVMQKLKKQGIQGEEAVNMAKLILMNTANPDKYDLVRKQGAGLLQLDKALETEVVVRVTGTNDTTADGKLEVGQLKEGYFEADLEFENFGNENKTYSVTVDLVKEMTLNGEYQNRVFNRNNFRNIKEEVVVPAKQIATVKVKVDFKANRFVDKESFVEGYLNIRDITNQGNNVDSPFGENADTFPFSEWDDFAGEAEQDKGNHLSVPFLGYYGDWGKPKAIDAFKVKSILENENRKAQFIVNANANSYSSAFIAPLGLSLPYRDNVLYFAPDSEGKISKNTYPNMAVRLATLRNMTEIEYSILDGESKETLRVLGESRDVRKLNRLSSRPSFLYIPESLWDGTIEGEPIAEGKEYIYQIKAKLNNDRENPTTQLYQYKVKADTQVPTFDGEISVDKVNSIRRKITYTVQDTGSGLQQIYMQAVALNKRNPEDSATEPGEKPDFNVWKPQYGKSLKLLFFNSETASPEELKDMISVENGRLRLPEDLLPSDISKGVEIKCNINGHENKAIEIEAYFDATEKYLGIYALDWMGEYANRFVSMDLQELYTIRFPDYEFDIQGQGGVLKINNQIISEDTVVASEKSLVSITYPKGNAIISHINIEKDGVVEKLLEMETIKSETADKYRLKQVENGYSFELEAKQGSFEVQIRLRYPKANLSVDTQLLNHFAGEKLSLFTNGLYFKDFTANNSKLTVNAGTKIKVAGKMKANKEATAVYMQEDDKKISLRQVEANAFEMGENVYCIYNGTLFINYILKKDTSLQIDWENKSRQIEGNGEIQGEHSDEHKIPNAKGKYPAVFLKTPSLFEVISKKNTEDGIVVVSGFVGYVDDSGLKKLTISLVDEKGNQIAKPIEYDMAYIKEEKEIRYAPQRDILYYGNGYSFSVGIKIPVFHANIRVEAESNSGKKGSITRRMFFDSQLPILKYEIKDRNLADEFAEIEVSAKDDSFLVQLYQGDSYIGSVDITKKTYETGDAEIHKKWRIPLNIGQNKITIRVKDAGQNENQKIIYVYRSAK